MHFATSTCIPQPAACIPRPAACIPQPWKRTRTATWCLKLRAHRPCSKGNDTIAIAKLAHCEAAGNNAIVCDNNKCDSTLTSVVDTNSGTVAGQEAQMKEITAVAKMLRYDESDISTHTTYLKDVDRVQRVLTAGWCIKRYQHTCPVCARPQSTLRS